MKLRSDYIHELNQYFKKLGSSVRFKKAYSEIAIDIIVEDKFIKEDSLVNLTEGFYDELRDFFKDDGIELSFNNTGKCFWAWENNNPFFVDKYPAIH